MYSIRCCNFVNTLASQLSSYTCSQVTYMAVEYVPILSFRHRLCGKQSATTVYVIKLIYSKMNEYVIYKMGSQVQCSLFTHM